MEAFTKTEKKCIECKCPNFISWSYWGKELHSCQLQGESDTIEKPFPSEECKQFRP